MQRNERFIIIIFGVIIAISLFLFSLKGRYQFVDCVSHDTWTGKVYYMGTNYINKNKLEKSKDDFTPTKDSFIPIDDFVPDKQ